MRRARAALGDRVSTRGGSVRRLPYLRSSVGALETACDESVALCAEHVVFRASSYREPRDSNSDHPVHLAIDMMAPEGSPVFAPAAGVRIPGPDVNPRSGSIQLFLLSGDGRVRFFAHLAAPPLPEVGQQVAAGEQVGLVGSTGVRVPHLHYSRNLGGRYSRDVADRENPFFDQLRLATLRGGVNRAQEPDFVWDGPIPCVTPSELFTRETPVVDAPTAEQIAAVDRAITESEPAQVPPQGSKGGLGLVGLAIGLAVGVAVVVGSSR